MRDVDTPALRSDRGAQDAFAWSTVYVFCPLLVSQINVRIQCALRGVRRRSQRRCRRRAGRQYWLIASPATSGLVAHVLCHQTCRRAQELVWCRYATTDYTSRVSSLQTHSTYRRCTGPSDWSDVYILRVLNVNVDVANRLFNTRISDNHHQGCITVDRQVV